MEHGGCGWLLGTERAARLDFPADMALVASMPEHRLGVLATVGTVGPYSRNEIVGIRQIVYGLAVMHVRLRDHEGTNELMLGIKVDVILVTSVALVVRIREARINVVTARAWPHSGRRGTSLILILRFASGLLH